jgi:hypothetical protein
MTVARTSRIWEKRKDRMCLGFSGGQDNNSAEPTQKENIHEKSFHAYTYRQIGSLS